MVILISLFSNCFRNHRKLIENSILYANSEGVAGCMTHLYFQKDGTIIKKSVCFGITTMDGTYNKQLDTFLIEGLNPDTTKTDLAIINKRYDKIGQIYKRLLYFRNADTLRNPIIYDAFDDETECPDKKEITDNTDFSSVNQRFSRNELLFFEKSNTPILFGSKTFMSESYYPNVYQTKLDSAISFYRKYNQGIPLETYYYFSNDTLMVKYYEWSSGGCKCLYYLENDDYMNVYQQIISKLIILSGNPKEVVGDLTDNKITQFERIWDTDKEHMELHLYLYGGYRICLIKYWK